MDEPGTPHSPHLLFSHVTEILVTLVLGGGMFTTKLKLVTSVLAVIVLIEPALAGIETHVPAPIIGAGLPVLAVLGGGYWLVKKLRERR